MTPRGTGAARRARPPCPARHRPHHDVGNAPPARHGPQLAALLAHSVLVQVVMFVLRPTGTYRALELGVPTAWLGVLSASFAVAPLLLAAAGVTVQGPDTGPPPSGT